MKKTAVLVFANSAEVDVCQKSSLPSLKLFNALTSHTLQTVKKSRLPFFHISEKQQNGKNFGERFSNAIQSIYKKGFENVITIGNDSPQLKASHLLEAEKQLKSGKTVLGPTVDGGFYLMGLHHSNFDPILFKRLPWQRFGLFQKVFEMFESANSEIFRLSVLHDVDTKSDVANLLSSSKGIPIEIFKILAVLLNPTSSFSEKTVHPPKKPFISLYYNKGSPAFANLA